MNMFPGKKEEVVKGIKAAVLRPFNSCSEEELDEFLNNNQEVLAEAVDEFYQENKEAPLHVLFTGELAKDCAVMELQCISSIWERLEKKVPTLNGQVVKLLDSKKDEEATVH